jgi:hypothetical protein
MKAKFNNTTKQQILERDNNSCVFCWESPHSIHHCFYGIQSERTKERNNIDKGVTLCFTHHQECHSCPSGSGLRQKAIDFIENLYNKD